MLLSEDVQLNSFGYSSSSIKCISFQFLGYLNTGIP